MPLQGKKVDNVEWATIRDIGRPHSLLVTHCCCTAPLEKLQLKVTSSVLRVHMLSQKFTLTQLQRTIETITGESLEKSAFRRRLKDLHANDAQAVAGPVLSLECNSRRSYGEQAKTIASIRACGAWEQNNGQKLQGDLWIGLRTSQHSRKNDTSRPSRRLALIGSRLRSKVNGREFEIGEFYMPSLDGSSGRGSSIGERPGQTQSLDHDGRRANSCFQPARTVARCSRWHRSSTCWR